MPLVKVKDGDTPLIKFCPDHKGTVLAHEPVFQVGGNELSNFYRCPRDGIVYNDVPASKMGSSN